MTTPPGSPLDRLLTWSLALSFGLTLISSGFYAANGWDDPTGAVFHILGGIAGMLVVIRLVTYLDGRPGVAIAALVIGMIGCGGVVGYGFNTIEVGLGAQDLVDASGAAVIIKPLGICWPLALLVTGAGLLVLRRVPVAVGAAIVVASMAFPVSRIGNMAWLALVTDVVLLAAFVALPYVLTERSADLSDDRHVLVSDG